MLALKYKVHITEASLPLQTLTYLSFPGREAREHWYRGIAGCRGAEGALDHLPNLLGGDEGVMSLEVIPLCYCSLMAPNRC